MQPSQVVDNTKCLILLRKLPVTFAVAYKNFIYTYKSLSAIILLMINMNSFQTTHTHTHTHPFNSPFSGSTQVSRYQKGKTNLNFTGARDSEWQWHQLGHMQVCTLLQTDNHASTPPLSFLQARCPSCCPTNSVKALKALVFRQH